MNQALNTRQTQLAKELEGWYAKYDHPLSRLLSALVNNVALAEEVLQEMWLGIILKPPPTAVISEPRRLFAWLLATARRRAIDLLRRERLRQHRALDEGQLAGIVNDDIVTRTESNEQIHHVLDQMARNGERAPVRLLELRYLESLSVTEIARLLKLTPRIVSARLQRAKRKFRKMWILTGGGRGTSLLISCGDSAS